MERSTLLGAQQNALTSRVLLDAIKEEGTGLARQDDVAVEAPLEVRFAGKPTTVLMRTPGDDEELVLGFLFAEGIISSAKDVLGFSRPRDLPEQSARNIIDIQFAEARGRPGPDRLFYSSSSCGACGKRTIESLGVTATPLDSQLSVSRGVLSKLPTRLRAAQPLFSLTGGVHASGLFSSDGVLLAVREDVGRHNALDKLVGWALSAGKIPLRDSVLLVSGRVSYELVQKAIAASIPILAAVGAPSSLAIEMAEQFNVTLVGFLREDGMNVYANRERVRL